MIASMFVNPSFSCRVSDTPLTVTLGITTSPSSKLKMQNGISASLTVKIVGASSEKNGSGFSFCENWGTEFHDYMWHVRTIDWWRNRFPGWDINFHGPSIEGKKDRFQGLHGYKT